MARLLRHRRGPRARQRSPHRRAGAGPVGRLPRTCSADVGDLVGERPPAVRRRGPRPADLRTVPRGRGRRRPGVGRGGRGARSGVLPTPGVAYLTDTLGADLGVMISASHNADAGQRDQVPRPRRTQARRRRRGRDRAAAPRDLDATRRAVPSGRCARTPRRSSEYAAHLVRSIDHPLDGPQGRGRLRRGCCLRGRARGRSPTPAPTWWRSTPRPTASTSTRAAARPTSSRCAAPS